MHGHERCGKDFGVDHHKLHVRLYAVERKNKRRVPESRHQTITAQAYEITFYDLIEHEAASTRRAWFWGFEEGFTVWMVLIHQVKRSKPSAGLTI